ncbi:MAG: tetratricopeptide repeat protein [Nitrososphaerales archaeon]
MLKQRFLPFTGVLLYAVFLSFIQPSAVSAQVSADAVVYVDRAVLAYDAKRYDEALKELGEALRLNPDSADALYYHGLVLVALKRPAEAVAALEKALKLRPGDVDASFQLGALYFGQKEYDKAEPLLRHVYQSEPKRQNLGYYLGFMEYRKKEYREAVRFFRNTVPSDDNFAQLTRFYSGLAMSALGFPKEAKAEIEEALRLQPVSPLVAPAQRFGELLDKKAEEERRFTGELRFGVFYDTNVAVVPNASSDLVAQTIRGDFKDPESPGELISINLSYTYLKTLDWEGTASYRLFQTFNNSLPGFNNQSHTPTIGIVNRGAIKSPFGKLPYFAGLQYTYDFITLGNTRFVQRWIVNPYFSLAENSWNLTNLQFRFQVKDFFNDSAVVNREVRDALSYMIGPTHFFLFDQGRHYLKLGYQYDSEDAVGKNWTYWGNRLLAGLQYTLPWWDLKYRFDLDFHWRNYKNFHSLLPTGAGFTKKRSDYERVFFTSLSKDFVIKSLNFTVSMDYLFDNSKSNLAAFDYDRHVVTTSIAWKF